MVKIDPILINLTVDIARTGYGWRQASAHEAKADLGTQLKIYAAN